MSEDKALANMKSDVMSLFETIGSGLSFANLDQAKVWSEIRETVDPRGDNVSARDLVNKPFTIKKIKPVLSTYNGGLDHFYFVVGVDQDGVVFNTALGGQAVVEELDAWAFACYNYLYAERNNDQAEMDYWASMGGNQPITVELQWNEGGSYNGYFTLA